MSVKEIHKREYGKGIGWHRLCGGKHNSPKDAAWFWDWVTCKKCLGLRRITKQEERLRLLEDRVTILEDKTK